MQAWRSRLLPTYPPLNRPNLPNTTLANSNSSTTPSRGLRPAKRARSRGRCGPPEETSAMVAVADLSLLAYPRRSSSPRCPSCLRRGSPYPRSRGWKLSARNFSRNVRPRRFPGGPLRRDKKGFPHDPLSHYPFLAARATKSVKSAARRGEAIAKCKATQAPGGGQAQEDRDKDTRSQERSDESLRR